MTANNYPHISSALCWDEEQAALTRLHNDANVLALPGRFIDFEVAAGIMDVFLSTDFEGGRHQHRVDKIAPSRA
jgi:ribose 5-phosphate isomerase B